MNRKTLTGRELIDDLIERQNYLAGEEIPNHGICMIQRQVFTVGLFTGCDAGGRRAVYHFNTFPGAMSALGEWKRNGGTSPHPPGNWRKYKSETGEILNPLYKKNGL